MSRDALQRIVLSLGAVVLCASVLYRYYTAGGPYFRQPRTVLDHVHKVEHPQRAALIAVPALAPLIPRGAEVTCFRPQNGQAWNDDLTYLTAVGLLPHHRVLPPFTAAPDVRGEELTEYVIAVGAPLEHPGYAPVAAVADGWLYKRR